MAKEGIVRLDKLVFFCEKAGEVIVKTAAASFMGGESECEICGSHGSVEVTFWCDACKKNHKVELRSW